MHSVLTAAQAAQLAQVPKSSSGYMEYSPCRVTLRSGEVLDRVYVVDESQFSRSWGTAASRVSIEDVVRIEDSPVRLPADLANKLYEAGESGMGYTMFSARMRDGEQLPFVVGNAVDFPNWRPGLDPRDVVDVVPHAGRAEFRDRQPRIHEKSAPYEWCLYRAHEAQGETFKRRWLGWTVSSLGYRVRIMGRNDLQYEDEFGRQRLFADPDGNGGIVVETARIRDRPERTRDDVVDRLRRAFTSRGWTMVESGRDG
ncbi:hypothetical protein [Demequina maris]|uniref:hypothetical protein n=1 Tax=Demequina maris TaxID=1638982 RepID=UPI000785F6C2|nr:hypothetical protein [Demequina maris]